MTKQKNPIVFKSCEDAAETMSKLDRVRESYEAALHLSVGAVPALIEAQADAQMLQIEDLLEGGLLDDPDKLVSTAEDLETATEALEKEYHNQRQTEMLLLALRGRMISCHAAQHTAVSVELSRLAAVAEVELAARVTKLTKMLDALQAYEGAVPEADQDATTGRGRVVVGIEPGTGKTEILAKRIQLLRSSAAQVAAGGHAFTLQSIYTGGERMGAGLWGRWEQWKPTPILTAETIAAEAIEAKAQNEIDVRAAAKADRRQREKASEAREKARAAATAEGIRTGDHTEARRLRDPELVKAQEEA